MVQTKTPRSASRAMNAMFFEVIGVPMTKGSTRIFSGRITSDNARLKAWERTVRTEAQRLHMPILAGPIALVLTFYLPRAKRLPSRITLPCTRPDVDKLARAIGDALTGVCFRDDGQIAELHARKVFAAPGTAPRAAIAVTEMAAIPTINFLKNEVPHGSTTERARPHSRSRKHLGRARGAALSPTPAHGNGPE
jgi:crossover junction endodeoxyribonuclease RusA